MVSNLLLSNIDMESMSMFDNEKFDTMQYFCDSSSREIRALDSSAQERTVNFL